MSTLRLGAYKLPAAEVVLVQTLFRLYSHGDTFRWTFVTAPPYDALLVDGTTDEGMNPDVDRMAKAVLRLTRMNSGRAPNTLERPIRADRLQDWLKSTEHDLLQTRPATLIEEATQPDAVEAEATTPAAPINPVRFKLRRWPPAVLLRSDPNRIRMAMIGAIVLTLRHKPGVRRQVIVDQIGRTPKTSTRLVQIKPGQGIDQ